MNTATAPATPLLSPRALYQDVAERLRQLPETRGAVLIALTGWGDANDRLRSKAAGFDHHLIKPADLAAVEALLAEIARQRS